MLDEKPADAPEVMPTKQYSADGRYQEPDIVSTKAEGGLQSEAGVLDEQARQANLLRVGENLLPRTHASSSTERPTGNQPVDSIGISPH